MKLGDKVKHLMNERTYRELKEELSYSSISDYNESRSKFFRKHILREKIREKDSSATILGNLVHHILSQKEFDEKFHIMSAMRPTGQMGDLSEALITRSMQSLNEYYEQQDTFKVIFADAFTKVKYNGKGEMVAFKGKEVEETITKFEGSDCEIYYNEVMSNVLKTVVSVPEIEKAERLVQKLKESEVTRDIVNRQTDDEVEVLREYPILFTHGELKMKCLPDLMWVHHREKCIQPWDYKTSWQDSESIENVYLKNDWWIQIGVYDQGITEWAKEHGLEGYEIRPMIYIVLDSDGFNEPFLLHTTRDDIDRAWRGYKVRSYPYKGISRLLEEISHHISTGIWNQSYEEYINSGSIKLSIPYGSRG